MYDIARYSSRSGISAGGFSIATNIILGIASAASFTSFAVSINYCSNRFFFCDFRPGRFFLRCSLMSFFLPMRSKRIFCALVLKKFGDVNLPTHFCKSQIAFLNINRKKAILQGIAFFWRFLFPSHFCAFCLVGARVKRNCVAFLSMRPRVNRIFLSFGISLSRWSRVSMHVAPFVACRPRAVVQKAIVVAKNAAKRVLPETGSWPEGKVSQYSQILCAVVQWGLDASTVPAHSVRCPWQVAQGKVISADRGNVLHVEDS